MDSGSSSSNLKENTSQYQLASKGLRVVNFLLDTIISQAISGGLTFALFMQINDSNYQALYSIIIVMPIAIPFLYYALSEHFLKGKTLAKFFTKTKVVQEDGSRISLSSLGIRSILRLIPIEPISFLLGKGWHDSMSRTMVIDTSSNTVFTELKEGEYQLADQKQRVINLAIDTFCSLVFTAIGVVILVILQSHKNPETLEFIVPIYACIFIAPILYYILCEYFLKGKTLAKFYTETKVVKLNGSRPDFMDVAGRSLLRYIPLEAFLGASQKGWHDTMSKTMVIKDAK